MGPVIAPPPFDELQDRILPWSQVKVICGLSRTTVWRLQKTGDFPACVQVSPNRVGWWQSELLAWKRAWTPRRLPERLAVPVEPKPVGPPVVAQQPEESIDPLAARAAIEGQAGSATTHRKRKASVPETQTAFDFGQ